MVDDARTATYVVQITSKRGAVELHQITGPNNTPWRKVFRKFGLSQSELARTLGCHRSKISRAVSDDKGLIHGRDQEMILRAAEKTGVRVAPSDMIAGA